MSITKGLVTALGGSITVKSQLSAGTTFLLTFPVNQINENDL